MHIFMGRYDSDWSFIRWIYRKFSGGNRSGSFFGRGGSQSLYRHGGDHRYVDRDHEDRGKCRAGFTAGRENAPDTEVFVSTSESGFSCLPLYFSEFFIKFIRNLLGQYQRRTLRHERTVCAGREKEERNAATGKSVQIQDSHTASREMCTFLIINVSLA